MIVRVRFDHPHGVRSKSRTERVVDLCEAATLEAVSAYVIHERPQDTISPLLFLVGGNGTAPVFGRLGSRRTHCATRT